MISEEKLKGQLTKLGEESSSVANELLNCDKKRAHFLETCLKSTKFTDDLISYNQFKIFTEKSLELLGSFTTSYQKILAYVLLIEKEGHRISAFKSLIARYQLMEKRIEKVKKIRRTEVKMLSALIKKKGFGARIFSYDFLRNFSEKLLKRKIKTEILLIMIVIEISRRCDAEVQEIKKLLEAEKMKERTYLAISSSLFLAPAVGTLLFLLSSSTLTWLNELTPNYKKLLELLD